MLPAGSLDSIVVFRRRVMMPATIGAQRGGFEDAGTAWGQMTFGNSLRLALGDFNATVPTGSLIVRSDPVSADVTAAYQAVVDGEPYEVRAVVTGPRSGSIKMDLVGANGRDIYAQELDQNGEAVVVRRLGSPNVEANARARVTGYRLDEISSGIAQGSRRVLLSVEDLIDAGWPVPPRRNDKIVVRGRVLNVEQVDDSTHLVAGTLMAYQIEAKG